MKFHRRSRAKLRNSFAGRTVVGNQALGRSICQVKRAWRRDRTDSGGEKRRGKSSFSGKLRGVGDGSERIDTAKDIEAGVHRFVYYISIKSQDERNRAERIAKGGCTERDRDRADGPKGAITERFTSIEFARSADVSRVRHSPRLFLAGNQLRFKLQRNVDASNVTISFLCPRYTIERRKRSKKMKKKN